MLTGWPFSALISKFNWFDLSITIVVTLFKAYLVTDEQTIKMLVTLKPSAKKEAKTLVKQGIFILQHDTVLLYITIC